MKLKIKVTVKSPIHLSSGKADVNVDSDVMHDEYGMPYFPARRFKGLLAESCEEIREMGERSGLEPFKSFSVDELFHHDTDAGAVQLIVPNLYLAEHDEYARMRGAWRAIQKKYASLIDAQDVLEGYTSVRYQTRLTNGVAAKGSLHNLRVVEAGVDFYGDMELDGADAEHCLPLIAAGLRNLRAAGGKRNRGFGRVTCTMTLPDGRTEDDILREALK